MSIKWYKTILYSLLYGIGFHLSAQQYGYVQYNSSTGAPFDQVSSVTQDEEGFIWIGSQNGLFRFDGIHFDNHSRNVKSQFIHQLHSVGDHILFVNEKSIHQIEDPASYPKVKALIEGTINPNDSLPFYPNNFIPGQDGSLWISQSNHSMGRLQADNFSTYPFSKSTKAQKLAIAEDAKGGIWVLSRLDGLFQFNPSANSFEKRLDIKNGRTLLIHDDYLLVGSENLHVYTLNEHKPQYYKTIALKDDQITAMYVDKDNQYIIGTRKGKLFKFQHLDQEPQTVYGANEAHRVEELDFGTIHGIYVTTDNRSSKDNLWVCSETGLWLLQQRFFKTVENLPMNNPIGIAIGREGKYWLPMNYLYEISKEGNEFKARTLHDNMQANAVAQDFEGFKWVSTTTPRVELLKYEKDRLVTRYDFHERGEAIFYLYPDRTGNLWFCQAPTTKPIVGVARINTKGEIDYYDEHKGFSSRVLAIKESSRGEIYAVGIGEDSYLYRYDAQEDRFVNLSPALPFTPILNFEAHDLTIDDLGVVWLATTDGLLRFDSEKITLIQNDILGQEEVRGVTHYSNNTIWVATATKGLVFYQNNTVTALGEQEGLPAVISAYRCIDTDLEGRLWAGTAEGLVYSTLSAATLPLSNSPRIRKITINSKELTANINQVFKVRKNQQVQLEFTNVSFPARKVQYQYRILPRKDKQIMLEEQLWESIGTNGTLKLEQKELGDYYLELRARQPGGYQWSVPLEIQFQVFQPWYLQSWVLYLLVGLVIVVLGYYLRFYVKKRFIRLQKVLRYSNEKLAAKEAQLRQKMHEFEEQREELDNANSNIQALELFIKEIPKGASWNDIITAMGKAVNQSSDINAFEIAFMENDEIVHRGYSDQERSGYTFRSKPFDAKNSLTCWSMSNKKEVLINDFKKEHTSYIQEKAAYLFNSLLFIPFTLANDQPVVLCAYSIRKNDFDKNDQIMFRILAQFIHFSIHHELTKPL